MSRSVAAGLIVCVCVCVCGFKLESWKKLKNSVSERRQARTQPRDALAVYVADHDAGPAGQPVQYYAPRVDEYRIAVRLAPVRMVAALRGREHVRKVLDRPGANERFPVRLAGRRGEG